jgi:peptidyl-prolyl cis-trans isomerase C
MSCTVRAQIPAGRQTPITVNGATIPRDAIQREMQNHSAQKPIAAWQQAARALVIRELLLQRARYIGLVAAPQSDMGGRRETDEEALIRALLEREVKIPLSDYESCRRYYERNQQHFRSPDIYEVSHILFAASASNKDGYAAARADAAAVLAALREDQARFADLARACSRCPSAAQGGNLGQITSGQTTSEFERALLQLKVGELCAQPVETHYGFHIIRLDRKHEGHTLPYDFIAARLAGYLQERGRRLAEAQYVARLISAAAVEGIDIVGADGLRVH